MKTLRSTIILMALFTGVGITSCAEDETLQDLLDKTELNQPLETEGENGGDDKPGSNG